MTAGMHLVSCMQAKLSVWTSCQRILLNACARHQLCNARKPFTRVLTEELQHVEGMKAKHVAMCHGKRIALCASISHPYLRVSRIGRLEGARSKNWFTEEVEKASFHLMCVLCCAALRCVLQVRQRCPNLLVQTSNKGPMQQHSTSSINSRHDHLMV